ncbi:MULTISPECIES: xanthine dehydrogenase accessory protein XdhC [unclassified Roseovarius]|uniref:xanthine dehydrogenase accessory protein XdhC n=1 Tax=unclassified Roseovarius TaxID=2614913 RepID=UPI00273D8C11|nr:MULTISPECIES: xanthine dehydrogenase accessory protein XdhC [unclassified Roseovarius]
MTLVAFVDRHSEVASVRLTKARGSSPREAGTEMFVAPGETYGTIGGGQLEYMMIDEARMMLAKGIAHAVKDVPLGPEIGQCCGGRVEVEIALMSAADRQGALARAEAETRALPHVYVMGAGHVGRALAGLLAQMPVRTLLVDTRAEEMALCKAPVDKRHTALPEAEITSAPAGSAFVVLTHDHALDFLLTAAALARGDAAYVGMIGSATKRARFESWCRDHGGGQETDALTCPIGAGGSADKRPEIIAAFVAAEIMAALTQTRRNTAPEAAETLHTAR